MPSIESAASHWRAERLSLLPKTKTLAALYHTVQSFAFTISNSNRENDIYKRCRGLRKFIIKMFGQTMAFHTPPSLKDETSLLSPLTSCQMDEETASQIYKKKGYCIPKPPTLVMSSKEASSWSEKGTQTKILVVTAFQFLQIEDVSRCAQLLSVQLSKIQEHGIETIFKHVANLLLCRSAQYLYLQCVYDSEK